MSGPRDLRGNFRWVHIFLLCLAIGVTLVLSIQLWTLSAQKIRDLRSSQTDNAVWTLGQLEVEFLQLEISLINLSVAQADPAEAAVEVQRRFNVYYSRIETLWYSPLYRAALIASGNIESLEKLRVQNDNLAPLIDVDNSVLASNASRLAAE